MNTEKLFVERIKWDSVYMELGLCCYYAGDKRAAKKMWEKILEVSGASEEMVEQAKKNLEFCL